MTDINGVFNFNLGTLPFPHFVIHLAFNSIPVIVALLAGALYKADFLQSQTPQFYDPGYVEEFDFIVIGAGSAGSVVSSRLSKHHRVLLLEGGGSPNLLTEIPSMSVYLQRLDSTDWQYKTEPQNNSCLAMEEQRSLWPRGKGLGGTSNLNFMVYQRGNPRDYKQLADATEDPDWEYENLLPFFKMSEDYHANYKRGFPPEKRQIEEHYHGYGGPLHVEKVKEAHGVERFLAAAKEMGYDEKDLNADQTAGFSELYATLKDGKRVSTYDAFIRPILNRKNLVIYRYARAVKIHVDKSRHAYGVTYFRHGAQKFVRAKREIIVSAGAIDSPKLLLLSGVGPREHLHSVGLPCRVYLPGVGGNLQDHVTTLVGPITMNAKGLLVDRDVNLKSFIDYARDGSGPLASLAGVSAVGLISSNLDPNSKWPDLIYFMSGSGVHRSLAMDFTRILGIKPGILQKYYGPHVGRDANFVLVTLGKPESRGEVRLATKNPWDKPLIQPNYFSEPEDMEKMKTAVKFIVNLYENTETYRRVGAKLAENSFPGCEQFVFKSDAYFECYIRHVTMTEYHPSGTCAMGKTRNDSAAVVDSQLRVRKVRGLRVADVSVLRFITNANLNAPAILIGEKAAFLVRSYWAQQFEVCTSSSYYLLQNHHLHCFYTAHA